MGVGLLVVTGRASGLYKDGCWFVSGDRKGIRPVYRWVSGLLVATGRASGLYKDGCWFVSGDRKGIRPV